MTGAVLASDAPARGVRPGGAAGHGWLEHL